MNTVITVQLTNGKIIVIPGTDIGSEGEWFSAWDGDKPVGMFRRDYVIGIYISYPKCE